MEATMEKTDYLALWSSLSLDEMEEWLHNEGGRYTAALEALFGEHWQELRAPPAKRGLAADKQPVVLIPGCGGSELHSVRGVITRLYLDPRLILKGRGIYLKMNAKGNADALPAIEGTALRCMPRAYDKMRLFLSRNAWLHEFPYDWRRNVQAIAERLHAAIEHWASGVAERKFSLVCHSMGGMVARTYLATHPQAAEKRIARVIMLGTPHYGVVSNLLNLLHGDLGLKIMEKINPANAPLEVARSFPSMFQTLPSPPEHFKAQVPYPIQGGWDLYRAESWRIDGIEQAHLDSAARFHALMAGPAAQVPLFEIAGCHFGTAVALKRVIAPGEKPDYRVTYVNEGPNSGDDTVPLWSTLPPGGTRYFVQAKHGDLPHKNEVLQAVLDLIHGEATIELPQELPNKKQWGIMDQHKSPELEVEDVDRAAERLRKRLADGTFDLDDVSLLQFGL
jgi:pimeloyl-ACP methyl ester carboxylesterase